jgi:predicted nucleic acid-binding protein
MVLPNPHRRIFLDSSVLYAAAFSATGPARRLILKGLERSIALAISDLVLEETKRNLTKNAPLALPYFHLLADLFVEVRKAAQIVHLKDAPIMAAAAKAKAEYLATHDVKHLLNHTQAIDEAYGIDGGSAGNRSNLIVLPGPTTKVTCAECTHHARESDVLSQRRWN